MKPVFKVPVDASALGHAMDFRADSRVLFGFLEPCFRGGVGARVCGALGL